MPNPLFYERIAKGSQHREGYQVFTMYQPARSPEELLVTGLRWLVEQDAFASTSDRRFGKSLLAQSQKRRLSVAQVRYLSSFLSRYQATLEAREQGWALPDPERLEEYLIEREAEEAKAQAGSIDATATTYTVRFPYDAARVRRVKAIWKKHGGQGWREAEEVWIVGGTAGPDLFAAFPTAERTEAALALHAQMLAEVQAREEAAARARAQEERKRLAWATFRQQQLQQLDLVHPFTSGRVLYAHQREAVRWLLHQGKGILADDLGLGKAQPLDARILTPTGWKTMGEMQVGEAVINSQGGISHVVGVYPQGRKAIFRVRFSDGSTTTCCEEHLWWVNTAVRRRRGQPGRALSLKEIMTSLRDRSGQCRHYLPMVKPVQFSESPLPVDPYLLGVLLGDGGLSGIGIRLASADEELLGFVARVLPQGVRLQRLLHSRYDWRVSVPPTGYPNPLVQHLKALGVHGHGARSKFIPACYLYASVASRIALLQGLLDTDGSVRIADNNIEYSTSSLQLAQDVRELVLSLGGTTRVRSRVPRYTHNGERRNGAVAYRMSVALPSDIAPFRLTRKAKIYHPRPKYPPCRAIVQVEYVGEQEAQCILVDAPDHLYVTNDYLLTHNTSSALVAAKALELPILVLCPVTLKETWLDEAQLVEARIQVHSWAKIPAPPEHDYVLIADECFPYGTEILTDHGPLPIGEIVECCLPVSVLSWNSKRQVVEYKPIARYVKRDLRGHLVRVVHEQGAFTCTPNHKLWTEEHGYVMAGALQSGTHLRLVSAAVSHANQRQAHGSFLHSLLCSTRNKSDASGEGGSRRHQSQTLSQQDLRALWSSLPIQRDQRQCHTAFLQQDLLQHLEGKTHGGTGTFAPTDQENACSQRWPQKSGHGATYEAQQSNAQPRFSGQDAPEADRQNIPGTWREWRTYITADGTCTGIAITHRVSDPDSACEGALSFAPTLLQSGCRRSGAQDCHRSGWENPSRKALEVSGSTQNEHLTSARVVRVEVLESTGDAGVAAGGSRNPAVYNLEVADNHNYLADGVLVSNCHLAQTWDAQRTQAMLRLARSNECRAVFLLSVSGETPVTLLINDRMRVLTMCEAVELMGLQGDGSYLLPPDTSYLVRSYDPPTRAMTWARIYGVQAHKSPEPLVTIEAQGKISLRVTQSHSVYVIRNGRIQVPKASEVQPGDFLIRDEQMCVPEGPSEIDMLARVADGSYVLYGPFQQSIVDLKPAVGYDAFYNWLHNGKHGPYLPYEWWQRSGCPAGTRWIAGHKGSRGHGCSTRVPVTALAYLVGLVTGDGWVADSRLGIAVADADVASLQAHLEKQIRPYFDYSFGIRQYAGCVNLRLQCKPLVDLFRQWFGGQKAGTKRLPPEVFTWPEEARREVLRGLVDSDGHITPRGDVFISSTSRMLLEDVAALLRTLHLPSVIYRRTMRPDPRPAYANSQPSYALHYWQERRQRSQAEMNAIRSKVPIQSANLVKVLQVTVDQPTDELVYDFAVEGTENFVAGGVVCHNTGTPIKNGRPANLYPLLYALDHPLSRDKSSYEAYFCDAHPTQWTRWDISGAAHLDELHQQIGDILLRRRKQDCLDLPPKTRVRRPAEISAAMRVNYEETLERLRADYQRRVKAGEILDKGELLVSLNHLRHAGSLAKTGSALELVEELHQQEQQVVVFVDFVDSAKRLVEALQGEGIPAGRLIGETPKKDRAPLVKRFQSGQVRVLVATLETGGVGLTLTAANTVILVDRPWTSEDAKQAEDRTHRIGQTTPVTAFWLAYGKIDTWIDNLLEEKAERIGQVLGEDASLAPLNHLDDLARLLFAGHEDVVSDIED